MPGFNKRDVAFSISLLCAVVAAGIAGAQHSGLATGAAASLGVAGAIGLYLTIGPGR